MIEHDYDSKSGKHLYKTCFFTAQSNDIEAKIAIRTLERKANLLTDELMGTTSVYEFLGGKAKVIINEKKITYQLEIELYHENFSDLHYMMQQLCLMSNMFN